MGGRPLARLHSFSTPAKAGHHPSSWSSNLEDLVCQCISSKSGDVTKETQSSFMDDVGDVEQARTTQNLIVRHEILPADVQDASLAP